MGAHRWTSAPGGPARKGAVPRVSAEARFFAFFE
jgi:hypothetical protein